jgi:hypothetical protein
MAAAALSQTEAQSCADQETKNACGVWCGWQLLRFNIKKK